MIGKLTGRIDSFGADWVILDVGGVGYCVFCGPRTLTRLGEVGDHAVLYIDTHVREDVLRLYGFPTPLEKDWFTHIQTVQGVGTRVALAILDVLAPGDLEQAILLGDKAAISRASGVGPKLAGRVISELKERPGPKPVLSPHHSAYTPPSTHPIPDEDRRDGLHDILLRNDAVSALVNLGYNEVRAVQAVASAYSRYDEDPSVDELIKAALKEISL